MKHVNPVNHSSKNERNWIKFTVSLVFILIASLSYGQSSKDIVPIVECVKYIGYDTYVATFGYNNLNNKDITVSTVKARLFIIMDKLKGM